MAGGDQQSRVARRGCPGRLTQRAAQTREPGGSKSGSESIASRLRSAPGPEVGGKPEFLPEATTQGKRSGRSAAGKVRGAGSGAGRVGRKSEQCEGRGKGVGGRGGRGLTRAQGHGRSSNGRGAGVHGRARTPSGPDSRPGGFRGSTRIQVGRPQIFRRGHPLSPASTRPCSFPDLASETRTRRVFFASIHGKLVRALLCSSALSH